MCKAREVFALVFYVIICFVSAKDAREDGHLIQKPENINNILGNETRNNEFICNRSESEVSQADDCKCKNGKCMRMCDVMKTIPCLNKKKVCTCSPQFAEVDGECKYCNCGQNFGCTFTKFYSGSWMKGCICPEGYYQPGYGADSGRCKPECSEKQPCKNGGTCRYRNCDCYAGSKGDLCEQPFCPYCSNRQDVDCLFDQQKLTSYCRCKNSSLFFDYESRICKPCLCGKGQCVYETRLFTKSLKCDCYSGYKVYNGYCKKCDCGDITGARCDFNSMGEKICVCPDGYFEREGRCHTCDCRYDEDTGINCQVINNVKSCFCPKGFHDVLGKCAEINECETNNTCHPSTTCYNMHGGKFYCQCPAGYKGIFGNEADPGEVCHDIDECKNDLYACWRYDNVKCVNLPGSYKCECLNGYEPSRYNVDPTKTICIKSRKSWWPAATVLLVTIVLIFASAVVHTCAKKRATRSN